MTKIENTSQQGNCSNGDNIPRSSLLAIVSANASDLDVKQHSRLHILAIALLVILSALLVGGSRLSEVTMAKSIVGNTQEPVDKNDVIPIHNPTSCYTTKLPDVPSETEDKAVWAASEDGLEESYDIDEHSVKTEATGYLFFSPGKPTEGLPMLGNDVEPYFDDKESTTLISSVSNATPTPTAISTPAPTSSTPTPIGYSNEAYKFNDEGDPIAQAAKLIEVRTGTHNGFDRVVFEFSGGISSYNIEYAEPHTLASPSELPVRIDGIAFLRARFSPVVAHDNNGQPTFNTHEMRFDLPALIGLEQSSDFGEVLVWILGLNKKVSFEVFELHNPFRIVIDIAHP